MQISNLELPDNSRWVNTTTDKNPLNNNNIDFVQTFWNRKTQEMPMLLQQPAKILLSSHETDQPLDFTMSKFKTKTTNTVANQLKQLNNFQQQKMLLHNNGYYSRNNNKSFTGASSPSSSEEEGVGPPESRPESPAPLRGDGKHLLFLKHTKIYKLFNGRFYQKAGNYINAFHIVTCDYSKTCMLDAQYDLQE